MANHILNAILRHTAGEHIGLYSICSAHPIVIEAAMTQAAHDDTFVLIEATSNQVDQFGGYTGMTPADFRDFVYAIADRLRFPRGSVVLGGDHLGPNRWQNLPEDSAMENASALVAAYVEAGYTKIHLDCSMSCSGDPVPVGDDLAAKRTARLMRVAEDTAKQLKLVEPLLYVIGTEVPVPGGAHETVGELKPTLAVAARKTLEQHQSAFQEQDLGDIWPRVIAMVVQPAVEFDHLKVIDYVPEATLDLQKVLDSHNGLVFEAHSTDYQTDDNLRALVEDHWAILKVGPGLTFAMREAFFALEAIEKEYIPVAQLSNLGDIIEERMLANPRYWQNYYEGSELEQRIARRYSFSDRLRYYWPDKSIHTAEQKLLDNLSHESIPLPLISQFLPAQYSRIRAGILQAEPRQLVIDKIRDALRPYSAACLPSELSTSESIAREDNSVV